MMHGFVKACSIAAALVLFVAVPLAAEEVEKSSPPEAAQSSDPAVAPHEGGGCSAGGKCCGSAACAEARKRSHEEGKAAMADCPCKRNRKKPDHTP